MRILGVDPGARRIGLALDDEASGKLALPHGVVERGLDDRAAAQKVKEALGELEVSVAVVGLPLRLDGTEGTAARRARKFGVALEQALGVPVEYWDERLTTVAAERTLREMGVRGQKQRRVVDETAAALLLQGYLDAREYRRASSASSDAEAAADESWRDDDGDG